MLYSEHWIELSRICRRFETFWKWMEALEKLDFLKHTALKSVCLCSLAFSPFKPPVMDVVVETAAALKWMVSPWFLDLTRSQVKNEPFVMSSHVFLWRMLILSPLFLPKTLWSPWIWCLYNMRSLILNNYTDIKYLLYVKTVKHLGQQYRQVLTLSNQLNYNKVNA